MSWWKWVGLAGVLGAVAVGGVVLQQRRHHRTWVDYPPEELRSKLRERLALAATDNAREVYEIDT